MKKSYHILSSCLRSFNLKRIRINLKDRHLFSFATSFPLFNLTPAMLLYESNCHLVSGLKYAAFNLLCVNQADQFIFHFFHFCFFTNDPNMARIYNFCANQDFVFLKLLLFKLQSDRICQKTCCFMVDYFALLYGFRKYDVLKSSFL